jgi:2-amino-4-hydroxy-6-hydroxymethyldihydropteridine diphosphokinase
MENLQNFQKILFGIGSNLGDKNLNIFNAIDKLKNYLSLKNIKISTIYKNPAMLPPQAPSDWDKEFYNIAISADINLENFNPLKILEMIKKIEKEIGRKDSERWAPREIDIDILLIDEIFIAEKNILTIPHEGLFNRDFFYKTVEEIEPKLLEKIRKKIKKFN